MDVESLGLLVLESCNQLAKFYEVEREQTTKQLKLLLTYLG